MAPPSHSKSEADPRPYPLYNTTYTLHRLSPLYTSLATPLSNRTLAHYDRPLRELLSGDVMRGVRVGLSENEDVLARVGILQSVSWKVLPGEDLWSTKGEDRDGDGDVDMEDTIGDTTLGGEGRRGVLVDVQYEKAVYTAILLGGGTGDGDGEKDSGREREPGFEHFPLLLTRMPVSLRETFIRFLEETFDARVSGLHLGRQVITNALERYITDLAIDEDGASQDVMQISRSLRNIVRDVQIVVGFEVGSCLKSVEMVVAREDIPRIVQAGRKIEKTHGGESPFMAALKAYVDEHLALDLGHEKVRILKVACAAFVLGSEGKAKFTLPVGEESGQRRATENLVESLVVLARGGKLSRNEK